MSNQFPKMLYRDGENTIVQTPAEMQAHLADQWGTEPCAKSQITIEKAREKVSFYIGKFQKWNTILKGLEGPGIVQAPNPTINHAVAPAAVAQAPAPVEKSVPKPTKPAKVPKAKKPVVKKAAKKPAVKHKAVPGA